MADETTTRSVDILLDKVRGNASLVQDIKTDPVATLQSLAERIKRDNPPITAAEDKLTFRIAVVVLGIVILGVLGLIGTSYLLNAPGGTELKIPEILIAMGSTALGALAGLLSPGARRA